MRSRLGACAVCLVLLTVGALASAAGSEDAWAGGRVAAIPYRELRYGRVVGQTSWVTCGPAAVATLLTFYLEMEVSEYDVVRAILDGDGGGVDTLGQGLEKLDGYSMLDLRKALARFGVESAGYRVEAEALQAYFDQGGHPVIVHLSKPQAHFAVAVGGAGGRVVLGDPALGERSVTWTELAVKYGFSGNVLVPIPDPRLNEVVRERQGVTLESHENRLVRLRKLGEAVL